MTGLQNAVFNSSVDTVYFTCNRISTCVSDEETSPQSTPAGPMYSKADKQLTYLLRRSKHWFCDK